MAQLQTNPIRQTIHWWLPTRAARWLFGLTLLCVAWWVIYSLYSVEINLEKFLVTEPLFIVPFFGGVAGLVSAFRARNNFSAVVTYLSLGLIVWSLGTVVWVYGNVYPLAGANYLPLADAVYFLAYPLWIFGVVHFMQSQVTPGELRRIFKVFRFFFLPFTLLLALYFLGVSSFAQAGYFIQGVQVDVLLGLVYAVGHVINLAILILLGRTVHTVFVSQNKRALIPTVSFLFAGFITFYLADLSYSFLLVQESYVAGSLADLLYLTALFFIGVGVQSLVHFSRSDSQPL